MAYREYREYDSNRGRRKVKYDMVERIGVLSKKDTGWTREVNIVAWNDGEAKVDIREWSPGRERMSRGITLPDGDAERLIRLLADRYGLIITENIRQSVPEPQAVQASYGNVRSDASGSGRSENAVPPADPDTVPFGTASDTYRQEDSLTTGYGNGAMAVEENNDAQTDSAGEQEPFAECE